ncbi:hypothetical protein KPL74_10975 [Bacillus sp. NP157]|nr:hypothetical protein KPL74_10975 [Bacillus sp. NP157]
MTSASSSAPTRLMRLLGFFGWFPSALLHRLGCLFVGSPDAQQLPANFWAAQADRLVNEPKVEGASTDDVRVGRIRVNQLRVLLTPRVAILAFGLSLAFCIAVQALLAGATGLANGWRHLGFSHVSAPASVASLDPELAKQCALARRHGARGTGIDPGEFQRGIVAKCGERPGPDEDAAAAQLTAGAMQ